MQRNTCIVSLSLMVHSQESLRPQSLDRIVTLAGARWRLGAFNSDNDSFPLGTVALLANVDLRYVRKAMEDKTAPLQTFEEDGEIYVAKDDALDWLKTQPGFKPTVVYDPI